MNAEAEATIARQLGLLSRSSLRALGDLLGVRLPAGDRVAELETLAGVIGSPGHLHLLERVLTPADWGLLSLLPLQTAPFQVPALLVPLRSRGRNAQHGLETVARLLACAAVLPVSASRAQARLNIDPAQIRNWARSAWLELAPGVAEWAQDRSGAPEQLQAVEPPDNIASGALPELRRVAFLLIGEARRKPIRLTLAGAPNKTDLRRVAAAIGVAGEDQGRRQVTSSSVPDLLYLALATLISARLLHVAGSELRPAPGSAEFFTGAAERQAAALLAGWSVSLFDDFACVPTLSRASGGDGPWMRQDRLYAQPTDEQISVARAAVAQAINRVVSEEPPAWHRIDALASFVEEQYPELLFARYEEYGLLYDIDRIGRYGEPAGPRRRYPGIYRRLPAGAVTLGGPRAGALYQDSDWMEVEGAFVRQVLAGSMRYLGLTEVGPGTITPDRFRLTELGEALLRGRPLVHADPGQASRAAIVQPNFEVVVVDALGNFGLLAHLDAFAERRSLDRAATYQLTQGALVRGLDQGWSGGQILSTLEAANGGPLPQNVRYSLDQWLQLYESLTLRELTTLLEVDEPAQLDRMLADVRLEPLFGKRLGPTSVLIPAEHLEEVLAAAREAGGLTTIDLESERSGAIRIREPDRIDLREKVDEPYLQYRLGALADVVEVEDGRRCYRMTPETVARAVEYGWSGSNIALFLEQVYGEELPAEFLVRLLGWSHAVPSLAVETLIAVQSGDGGLDWELLRQIPAVNAVVRAVLNSSVALISARDVETLRAELGSRGLTLQDDVLSASVLAPVIQETALRAALERYWEGPQAIRQTLQALGVAGKRPQNRRGRA